MENSKSRMENLKFGNLELKFKIKNFWNFFMIKKKKNRIRVNKLENLSPRVKFFLPFVERATEENRLKTKNEMHKFLCSLYPEGFKTEIFFSSTSPVENGVGRFHASFPALIENRSGEKNSRRVRCQIFSLRILLSQRQLNPIPPLLSSLFFKSQILQILFHRKYNSM